MTWNPQPRSDDQMVRRQYYAGYSDGYHGYHFGSGEEDPSADYRRGYAEGRAAAQMAA